MEKIKICLIIEKDESLWQSILIRLRMCGFKWYRTGIPLDDLRHVKSIIQYGGKGLGINTLDKTVAWTREPTKHYDYFIEVIK